MALLARWCRRCYCMFTFKKTLARINTDRYLLIVNVGQSVLLLPVPRLQTPHRIGRVLLAWLDRHHFHSGRGPAIQFRKQSVDGTIAWAMGSEDESLWSCLVFSSLLWSRT